MTTAASQIGQTVWVYRGSMWAYPWYTSVRKTLEDPACASPRARRAPGAPLFSVRATAHTRPPPDADWYVKFKPAGPWYSDKCDANVKTLCSDFYHSEAALASLLNHRFA